MACERIAVPGGFAIICGARRRLTRCTHCREQATHQCDACDAWLCRHCRIHVPPDQDFCRAHRAEASAAAAALREASR
jgi:hypothetical protein